MIEEGLLQRQEVETIRWYEKENQVSYELLWEYRYSVLKAAFERSDHEKTKEYRDFMEREKDWTSSSSLYLSFNEPLFNRDWLS